MSGSRNEPADSPQTHGVVRREGAFLKRKKVKAKSFSCWMREIVGPGFMRFRWRHAWSAESAHPPPIAMYRRRILLGTPGSTPVVRVQRTTSIRLRPRVINSKAGYATEIPPSASGTLPPPPPPPRKKGFLRRTLLYTSIFAGTFYGGSTLVALKNDRYHDFFVESVPGGTSHPLISSDL